MLCIQGRWRSILRLLRRELSKRYLFRIVFKKRKDKLEGLCYEEPMYGTPGNV